jgi:hypothetical protein
MTRKRSNSTFNHTTIAPAVIVPNRLRLRG